MPGLTRRHLLTIIVLMCTTVGLSAVQKKKSSTPAKQTATAIGTEPAKAIAVHEFQVEGVDVALMEVTRTAPGTVTVKWEYRNKTAQPQKLAGDSKGWSDPYRLTWNSYLLAEDGKNKLPWMKDEKNHPIAATHGVLNQLTITVAPRKTLKTWAKYAVPDDNKKVTVVIAGAEPFEGVEITEPATGH